MQLRNPLSGVSLLVADIAAKDVELDVALRIFKPRIAHRLENHRRGHTIVDRLPIVFHQPLCRRLTECPAVAEWDDTREIGRERLSTKRVARRTDLQYQRRSPFAKHTMKLAERADEIRDMAEGKTQAHEIGAFISQRQIFRHTLDKGDAEISPRHGEHRFAHIDTDHIVRTSGDSNRLSRDEAGADGHIDNALALLESRIDERPPPVSATATQRKY